MLLKSLQKTDIDLFYLVNSGVKNPFFDFLTIFISDTVYIYILLISYFSFKNDRKVLIQVLFAMFLLSILVFAVKYWISEPRPYEMLEGVILLKNMGTQPSFPSGHTTIAFGFWIIFTRNIKNSINLDSKKSFKIMLLLLWAFLVAFSRIYVGVHFPHDVLGGMLIGVVFGYIFIRFSEKIIK
ncbi:phosphoesterase, PA-phosphatase related protein [Methanococcus maripaludis C5]|uniref:Phosphoesterase, PA-phosphatase related protein n=1 Tax=Methanococcus maripaludis (strain C5 / ATCC BAA-1333) TaxID=402880 RepID=A4G0U1_METM5|nr:phosphatase PAP2 family protein [Methanococcus maripaludis]ABO36075.1 phosphoesterase, PA-phosphatase related protein [Methanococcus maripaludis C5]